MNYREFLATKKERNELHGFKSLWLPDFLYDFENHLTEWAIRTGRAGIFADCGLGKTAMQLVWAENVARKTGGNVLVIAPLAVSPQTVREGEKFGIRVRQSREGRVYKGITVTNYQRLHYFRPEDFEGVVVDESSILKAFDGSTRRDITEFLTKIQYRLLCTATPAPNDFMELGTSAEALGMMKYHQMLSMFFVNDGKSTQQWRLRGHAKRRFWHWVSTWARAIRKPSDLGFDDGPFVLPPLLLEQYEVSSPMPELGFWSPLARTLGEQRAERRRTIAQRCEKVAELVSGEEPFIAWCHLNAEGDLLEKLIPDAVQVAGSDDVNVKEDRLDAFSRGCFRVLVTKPKIGGFGLNWQHCSKLSFFPSHSWEQWYQAVRRCWRFGQKKEVTVNIVTSEAESLVLSNMQRKEKQAQEMYDGIVREMSEFQLGKGTNHKPTKAMKVPEWLSSTKP